MDDLMKQHVIAENDQIEKYTKDRILKEGWLQKQSRYLGSWRQRWIVLYLDEHNVVQLCTFKEKQVYRMPTEVITLNENMQICKDAQKKNEFSLRCTAQKGTFSFKADEEVCLTQWIQQINSVIPSAHKDKQCYGAYEDEAYAAKHDKHNHQSSKYQAQEGNDDNKEDLL